MPGTARGSERIENKCDLGYVQGYEARYGADFGDLSQKRSKILDN
jgi:hypothetical protein